MISRKIKDHESAQVQVHEYRKSNGDIQNMDILVSYTTCVLSIDYDSHLVVCDGLYSRTTIKHIGWFMREKGMNYFIAKQCYEENQMYDFVEKKFLPRPA